MVVISGVKNCNQLIFLYYSDKSAFGCFLNLFKECNITRSRECKRCLFQASDSDEDAISDDEFVPVNSKHHPGNVEASVSWFQETQATQIYDPTSHNFIAEWFHGVISRRYITVILYQHFYISHVQYSDRISYSDFIQDLIKE